MNECTKCSKPKPISEFNKDSSRTNGLNCWCKVCMKEQRELRKKEPYTPPPESKDPINNKICTRCGKELPKISFWENKKGLCSWCKVCYREYNMENYPHLYYIPPQPKDPINNKICTKCGREQPKFNFTKSKNKTDGLDLWCKNCYKDYNSDPKIKERVKEAVSYRYNNDLSFRLKNRVRSRVMGFIENKNRFISGIDLEELMGCTWEFLKEWIESQFYPEMTWENHSKKNGGMWEIDHIIPFENFNIINEDGSINKSELKKCCHYTNLQPLFTTTAIAESFGYTNIIGNRNKGVRVL